MSQRRVSDYIKKDKGPTLGCADVTIVSIAAITSFVILILILSRSDLSNLFENISRSTPVGAIQPTPDRAATVRAVATATPSPAPTSTPAPTPIPKKAILKTSCNLRPEPSVNKGTKGEFKPGVTFIILGTFKENEGIRWVNVEVDDASKNQGWMWDSCFDL